MSRVTLISHGNPRGFPRVSGDEPVVTIGTTTVPEFSPRERG